MPICRYRGIQFRCIYSIVQLEGFLQIGWMGMIHVICIHILQREFVCVPNLKIDSFAKAWIYGLPTLWEDMKLVFIYASVPVRNTCHKIPGNWRLKIARNLRISMSNRKGLSMNWMLNIQRGTELPNPRCGYKAMELTQT